SSCRGSSASTAVEPSSPLTASVLTRSEGACPMTPTTKLILVLGTAALAVAACGDDDTETADEPAATESAPATDPPATEPAATDPPATEPAETEPTATASPTTEASAPAADEVSVAF